MQTVTFKFDHKSTAQFGPNKVTVQWLCLNKHGVKTYWVSYFDGNGQMVEVWADESELSEIA